ncbi:hypothetical protein DSO57_1013469 [Entomophthora muscae]|uniref:Uncharacterized protein n=1 Tax=Entomophthora muscae TaxID=34485 RepID=A0ACC2U3Z3_9FUNG|nr:hypothetical protein DSO57_1013469 [Entomophthora muscae]
MPNRAKIWRTACSLLHPPREKKSPYHDDEVDQFLYGSPSRVPDSYKDAIFHVALWAIHFSVIHSFDEKAAPTQIHQALIVQKLSMIATQEFFGNPRNKKCKDTALEWANIPGLVIIDTDFSITIVPPELDHVPLPLTSLVPIPSLPYHPHLPFPAIFFFCTAGFLASLCPFPLNLIMPWLQGLLYHVSNTWVA